MPDMDRISPLPPFWSKNTLLSLLQLFLGILRSPEEDPKHFPKLFFFSGGRREWVPGKPRWCPRAARRPGAPSGISQISAGFWKLLPAGRKLSEFKVRFVCLPSRQTQTVMQYSGSHFYQTRFNL